MNFPTIIQLPCLSQAEILINNGFDPVLGPPNPPVIFQVFASYTGPGSKLQWTVPEVLIKATGVVIVGPTLEQVRISLTSYTTQPANTSFILYAGTFGSGVVRGVTPELDHAAGFFNYEIDDNGHPSFFNDNYGGPVNAVFYVTAVENAFFDDTVSPPFFNGTRVISSQQIVVTGG